MLVLLQPLSKMFLVMEYQVNKNYIARVFCENKSKPLLHCEGKCHLAKELKQADQAEKKLPQTLKDKMEVLYFVQFAPVFSFYNSLYNPEFNPDYFSSFPKKPDFGIFHPPRFLA